MTTVTLQDIKAEHSRLAAMIAQLEASAPTLLLLRETSIELQPGERYAGLVLHADGKASHHLVLLPGEGEDLTWQAAKDWATQAGGELPTRQEQALLYANLKAEFEAARYWSCQAHETNSSGAWLQHFSLGLQYLSGKSFEAHARAVRRFTA